MYNKEKTLPLRQYIVQMMCPHRMKEHKTVKMFMRYKDISCNMVTT